ncbi:MULTISPECIES: SDR family oxidoreductase [unclassified Streptomyces]|uniref:SDR family NAD(P)-dependent oxidoreductase n=1 Tax=unclassified Streptomyces TaxID=2593676 RepID=UPI000B891683|nr:MULTISPECIES: SDR family oxidoreductase [unclassified Streptomyces]MYZ34638.1 SDR family oxidoreductase [Streptomyces sp. SID4917]
MRFVQQTAVVAGGFRGIGSACIERFGAEGAAVHVMDLSAERSVDICDSTAVSDFIESLPECPTVAVNAVGNANLALLVDQDVAEFRRILEIELVGAYNFIQAVARRMIRDSVRGSIVSISSVNERFPSRGLSGHCSAKAGLIMLTRVAAVELGEHGIRVNAVSPGCTLTPLTAPFAKLDSYAEEVRVTTPLEGRMGEPEEIAAAVAFLASRDAAWVTGHVLHADGGQGLVYVPDPLNAVAAADPWSFTSQVLTD